MEWIRTADRDNLSQKLKYSIGALLTVFNLSRHQSEIEELSIKRTTRKATKEITSDKLIKAIIDKLTEMNPREFEKFISHLLNLTGFEAATTQYVGDKGIDIEGTLNAEGLANVALKV
jgi:HJR/Mrr/RecB family endonuclease